MARLTTETKKVSRPVTTAAKTRAAAPKTLFALKSIARPKEGQRLFAHTQAVLELLGLNKGKSVDRPRLVTYIGMRALCYHVGNGNFAESGATLTMTKQGKAFFAERKTDPAVVDGFLSVFRTGKANEAAQVKAFQIEQVA